MTVKEIFEVSPVTYCHCRNKRHSAEDIIESVAEYYKISPFLLTRKTRIRPVVEARMIAMHLIRLYTPLPLKTIGSYFQGDAKGKGKDHTTVVHSLQTLKDLMDTDRRILQDVLYLKRTI